MWRWLGVKKQAQRKAELGKGSKYKEGMVDGCRRERTDEGKGSTSHNGDSHCGTDRMNLGVLARFRCKATPFDILY